MSLSAQTLTIKPEPSLTLGFVPLPSAVVLWSNETLFGLMSVDETQEDVDESDLDVAAVERAQADEFSGKRRADEDSAASPTDGAIGFDTMTIGGSVSRQQMNPGT